MALLSGSPAIDTGSNAFCVDTDGFSIKADQRGLIRIRSRVVDIGAYETQPSPAVSDFIWWMQSAIVASCNSRKGLRRSVAGNKTQNSGLQIGLDYPVISWLLEDSCGEQAVWRC